MLGEVNRLFRIVGSSASDNRNALVGRLNAKFDHPLVLIMRQRGRLAGRADRNQSMTSFRDLPFDKRREGAFVKRTAFIERRHQRRKRPFEHFNS